MGKQLNYREVQDKDEKEARLRLPRSKPTQTIRDNEFA
jgi:hypothetical protein